MLLLFLGWEDDGEEGELYWEVFVVWLGIVKWLGKIFNFLGVLLFMK